MIISLVYFSFMFGLALTFGVKLGVVSFITLLLVAAHAVDLVFAVDGSKGLTSEQFHKLKNMIKKILDFYAISLTATHVGLIEFSYNSNEKIRLTDSYDREEIYSMIDAVKQSGGDRRVTDQALKMAAERMFSVNFGGRVGASRALVVVTAGRSTGEQAPSEMLKPLEKNGVRVYVVSVGNEVDKDEIHGIVPSDTNIFPTPKDDPDSMVLKIVRTLNKDLEDSKYRTAYIFEIV